MCTPAGHISASRALKSTSLPCKGRLHQKILLAPPLDCCCYSPAAVIFLANVYTTGHIVPASVSYTHLTLPTIYSV